MYIKFLPSLYMAAPATAAVMPKTKRCDVYIK